MRHTIARGCKRERARSDRSTVFRIVIYIEEKRQYDTTPGIDFGIIPLTHSQRAGEEQTAFISPSYRSPANYLNFPSSN